MDMKITTTEVVETECCSARVIQAVETKFARGTGEAGDPVRMVTQYWSLDGELLAETEAPIESKSSLMRGFQRTMSRLNIMRKHLHMKEADSTLFSLVTELLSEIQHEED